VFARFRYNDLKEDAGGCGGCGLRAGPGLTALYPDGKLASAISTLTALMLHDFQDLQLGFEHDRSFKWKRSPSRVGIRIAFKRCQ